MNETRPYTYRIMLASYDGDVIIEKHDPNGILLGQPVGPFAHATHHATITALSAKAFADEISETEIQTLGETLFNALFDQALRSDFLTFYEKVLHQEKRLLRLELDINEARLPEVVAWPWEFLRVPDNQVTGNLWLATTPQVIFSRRRAQWIAPQPIQLAEAEKLRIAVVVSTPTDEELGKVSYDKLFAELEKLAPQLGDSVTLELANPTTRPATRETIDEMLENAPHIFHFVGHGRFQNDTGEIAIVRDNGRARWVNAQQFSGLFARHRPGIVLLQACEGGQTSASRAFAGVASQIVRHNIPVVLAMQYEISNAAARKFAREFYNRLAQGEPVDKAAQEGRYEISDFHETRDFATPVLYMRVADGRLFVRPSTSTINKDQPIPSSQLPLNQRKQLLDNLNRYFNLDELRGICFEMGIEYENFSSTKDAFVTALIKHVENNNQVAELKAIGKRERGFLSWD